MKYWIAVCPCHGQVKIKQKTMPTTCKEKIAVGAFSTRLCGDRLSDQRDVTTQVELALSKARV